MKMKIKMKMKMIVIIVVENILIQHYCNSFKEKIAINSGPVEYIKL